MPYLATESVVETICGFVCQAASLTELTRATRSPNKPFARFNANIKLSSTANSPHLLIRSADLCFLSNMGITFSEMDKHQTIRF